MRKIMLYYLLFMKAALSRKRDWIQWILWIGLVFLILQLRLPDAEKKEVGIYYTDMQYASQIGNAVTTKADSVSFVRYEDLTQMREDLMVGTIDCGFQIMEDLEKNLVQEELEHCIMYYETPFTTKGEIAKEYLYAAFMKVYDPIFLEKRLQEIIPEQNGLAVDDYLIEQSEAYLQSDVLFDIQLVGVDGQEISLRSEKRDIKMAVIGALMIAYLGMQLYGTEKTGYRQFTSSLHGSARIAVAVADYLAESFIPALTWILLVSLIGWQEIWYVGILRILIFLLMTGIYMGIVWLQRWKEETKRVMIVVMDLLMIIVNPIVLDLTSWIPILRWIRYVTPLWYLCL